MGRIVGSGWNIELMTVLGFASLALPALIPIISGLRPLRYKHRICTWTISNCDDTVACQVSRSPSSRPSRSSSQPAFSANLLSAITRAAAIAFEGPLWSKHDVRDVIRQGQNCSLATAAASVAGRRTGFFAQAGHTIGQRRLRKGVQGSDQVFIARRQTPLSGALWEKFSLDPFLLLYKYVRRGTGGLDFLVKAKRLDLAYEQFAVDPRFEHLFDEETRRLAAETLKRETARIAGG